MRWGQVRFGEISNVDGGCLADATAVDSSLPREVIDDLLDEFWNAEYKLLRDTAQEVLAETKSNYPEEVGQRIR